VSWRLARELLFIIVDIVAWGCFIGAVMAVVVNVGAVMGAGISTDVISICCKELLHMTLTGFGLKSTSSRNRLKRSRQVLKPVRAKIAFL
jgi:hypothetical protein